MSSQDAEFVVHPDKMSDASMEKLLDVLCNCDVMIYVADADILNSTDKVKQSALMNALTEQQHNVITFG